MMRAPLDVCVDDLSMLLALLQGGLVAPTPPRRAAPPLVPSQQFVTCPTPGCNCYPIRADRVARHLKRCPKLLEQAKLAALGFWTPNANSGADEATEDAQSHTLGGRVEESLAERINITPLNPATRSSRTTSVPTTFLLHR